MKSTARTRKTATVDSTVVATTATTVTPIVETTPLVAIPRASEFTVDHGALKGALTRLIGVVDKRSNLPILANIAIRSRGATVELVGTDLDVWLTISLATGKGAAEFGTTIAAHKLSALVRTLPDGEVAFSPAERHTRIVAGRVTARLEALPDRDYPKIPTMGDAPWVSADAAALRRAVDSVTFSVCKDTTRFHLNGALAQCDGHTCSGDTLEGVFDDETKANGYAAELRGVGAADVTVEPE
jgi:DNA polymerase-3 subunit beta